MTLLFLDTSVIFDLFKRRFGRPELLTELIGQGFELAFCSVNITEVYFGLRQGEETETELLLSSLICLPVSRDIARLAGLLRRDWRRRGHTLSFTDVTIAAVAISNHAPLLTDNQKHFPMPELQLWPLPPRPN